MLLAKMNGNRTSLCKESCHCATSHGIENCATRIHTSKAPVFVSSMIATSNTHDDRLVLDFGASGHMVRSLDWFVQTRNIEPKSIVLGNGQMVVAHLSGDILIQVVLSSGGAGKDVQRKLKLRDVLYVADLTTNLISCSQLCRARYDINHIRLYIVSKENVEG